MSVSLRTIAIRMRSQGYTFAQIAAALDKPLDTVYGWSRHVKRGDPVTDDPATKDDEPGVSPGPKLKKATMSREEMIAWCERGESSRTIARAAGITHQAVHSILGTRLHEVRTARNAARDMAARQSASYFRAQYRAELAAAGWKLCPSCREWRDPDTHGRCNHCRFCNNERARQHYTKVHGLPFIPNDPEVWWHQRETGESRTKLVRRRGSKTKSAQSATEEKP